MRVYSKHEAVNVTVDEVSHRVDFAEESPGIYVMDMAPAIARKLLSIGLTGGFWSNEADEPVTQGAPLRDAPLSSPPTTTEGDSPHEGATPPEPEEPTKRRRK